MSRYENFIIQNKVNEYLTTKLGMSQFLTVDTSLTAQDGMKINVHKYTKSGTAQTVDEGADNSAEIAVTYANVPHTVTTTQAKTHYTDEDAMTDSYYVDKLVEALAESIVNEYNALAVAEFEKTTNVVNVAEADKVDFDTFADALAVLNVEDQDEHFFALINPKMKAEIRKNLADELKYVEDYARVGYVGSICGVPIYVSKAISDNEVIIANKEAVTAFMKKDSEVEQDRDAGKRTNYMWARNVKVIALTDESKCVKIVHATAEDAADGPSNDE